jgi:hypothetical protein
MGLTPPRHALGVSLELGWRVAVGAERPVLVPDVDVRVVEVGLVLTVVRVRDIVRVTAARTHTGPRNFSLVEWTFPIFLVPW